MSALSFLGRPGLKKHPVEMIDLVLNDPGVEVGGGERDGFALDIDRADT